MRLLEVRIPLPFTVDEYHIGQLWCVAEGSKQETGGGDGVQIVKNEPFSGQPQFAGQYDSGQYTQKVYHVRKKAGVVMRKLFDAKAFKAYEEAWNAHPFCKTVVENRPYFKENFRVEILSMHVNGKDIDDNIFQLSDEDLKLRKVIDLDIASDKYLKKADITADTDIAHAKSVKTGRGPLLPGWMEELFHNVSSTKCAPMMIAYKLVRIRFTWFGVQRIIEGVLTDTYPRLFTLFHRKCLCWMDKWYGLTIEQIRQFEEETAKLLDELREKGEVQGMIVE